MTPSHRLVSIDFLRGCAALGVVLTHSLHGGQTDFSTPTRLYFWFDAIVSQGVLGVPLFFVISGFCIHQRWAKQYAVSNRTELDFFAFWRRRMRRLYPPYVIVLCIGMAFVVAGYLLLGRAGFYPEPRARWIAIDFVAHLLMLHGFHPLLDAGGNNPQMWTLAREEYFYIMYFPLLAWRRALSLAGAVACVLILGLAFPFMMRFILPEASNWWTLINYSAPVLWIQWCLGMVAVEAYYDIIKLPRWCRVLWMVFIWFIAFKISVIYFQPLSTFCIGMTFFTLLNYCVTLERNQRWRNYRLVIWLANVGLFSYSLYLIHYLVIDLLTRLTGVVALPADIWRSVVGMAIKTAACIYIAKLFFNQVERHFLNSKANFRTSKVVE
ncbi:MAG: acyltransferase family protein [Pyrinomonadaceae bacterium]